MNPETGELLRRGEVEELEESVRADFVPIPERLDLHAQALLEFRDDQRKLRARQRNRIAKESRRRNRGER